MKKIEYISIHCSDSEWGSASVIREWHLANGWKDIGYHFVILNGKLKPTIAKWQKEITIPLMDGNIEVGRYLDGDNFISPKEVGAHTLGYNSIAIGICLIGVKNFTEKQFKSLEMLLRVLLKLFKLDKSKIKGHCFFDKKRTCPNFDVDQFIKERLSDI